MQRNGGRDLGSRSAEPIDSGFGSGLLHDREAYMENLVRQAIDFLRTGHEIVHSAELAKWVSEMELKRYRDEVVSRINVKLCELEARMTREAAELVAAKRRVAAAEERAKKAELSLRRLQQQAVRKVARLERPAA